VGRRAPSVICDNNRKAIRTCISKKKRAKRALSSGGATAAPLPKNPRARPSIQDLRSFR
jgi:hypothetical protein